MAECVLHWQLTGGRGEAPGRRPWAGGTEQVHWATVSLRAQGSLLPTMRAQMQD